MDESVLYDDGKVILTDTGVTLRHYYFPTAMSKHVSYEQIRTIDVRPMTWSNGKGRGWGSSHPGYWFPLDTGRARKSTLVILDLGKRVKPVFSPEDPERFQSLLRQRVATTPSTEAHDHVRRRLSPRSAASESVSPPIQEQPGGPGAPGFGRPRGARSV